MEIESMRSAVFAFFVIFFSILEYFFPRRKESQRRLNRWIGNYFLIFIGNILIKSLFPTGMVFFINYINKYNFGVFNQFDINHNSFIIVTISILILDLSIYLQHWAAHFVPFIKNLHRVHHSDRFLDVSSAIRFHPLEIIFSYCYKIIIVIIFGIQIKSYILFEIILNASAIFNHSNLKIPKKIDKYLKLFLITPDMHRIHHSEIRSEMNSNYGFFVPWWDKIFNTYTNKKYEEQKDIIIGVKSIKFKNLDQILELLKQPFIESKHDRL